MSWKQVSSYGGTGADLLASESVKEAYLGKEKKIDMLGISTFQKPP